LPLEEQRVNTGILHSVQDDDFNGDDDLIRMTTFNRDDDLIGITTLEGRTASSGRTTLEGRTASSGRTTSTGGRLDQGDNFKGKEDGYIRLEFAIAGFSGRG